MAAADSKLAWCLGGRMEARTARACTRWGSMPRVEPLGGVAIHTDYDTPHRFFFCGRTLSDGWRERGGRDDSFNKISAGAPTSPVS